MDRDEPTLAQVKAMIEKLPREDRAMLRPWILGRYDVRGYRVVGFAGLADGSEVEGASGRRRPGSATP